MLSTEMVGSSIMFSESVADAKLVPRGCFSSSELSAEWEAM